MTVRVSEHDTDDWVTVTNVILTTPRPPTRTSIQWLRPMALQTCPTTIVRAHADRLWYLLTTPAELARWSGAKLLLVPTRPLKAGDRLMLGAGIVGMMKVIFDIIEVEPPRRLALDISLPFGITNHELVIIAPISPSECRVTFN
jgi:hypothetical protein